MTIRSTMLFPLADALAIPLHLHKSGKITGTQDMGVDAGKHTVEFTAKVVSSHLTDDEAGVLVKIRKRLWLYLCHKKKGSTLTLLLIDAAKAGFHESGPDDKRAKDMGALPLEKFMMQCAPAVVAMFTRPVSGAEWSAHEFNSVDKRQAEADRKGAGVSA